jgi:hypothetical protein
VYLLRRQWLPISVIPRIKVLNTKTLYLELNYTLTESFALIGNHRACGGDKEATNSSSLNEYQFVRAARDSYMHNRIWTPHKLLILALP